MEKAYKKPIQPFSIYIASFLLSVSFHALSSLSLTCCVVKFVNRSSFIRPPAMKWINNVGKVNANDFINERQRFKRGGVEGRVKWERIFWERVVRSLEEGIGG